MESEMETRIVQLFLELSELLSILGLPSDR